MDPRSTQTKREFIITSEREDWAIKLLCWNDRTFDQAIHTQAQFCIFTSIPYINDGMTNGELEVLAYVWVEAYDIDILNGLILPCLIVETHSLGSSPVQDITVTQRVLLLYRMRGTSCIVKLTFPLDFDQVSRSRYLLKTPHGSLITFR